jgi:hypothetical protein
MSCTEEENPETLWLRCFVNERLTTSLAAQLTALLAGCKAGCVSGFAGKKLHSWFHD